MLIRLLYYLPMEMTKIDENIQTAQNMLSWIVERCYELEEENKKLKEAIKDHQLYEEKLEHRIIEFEELLHWE